MKYWALMKTTELKVLKAGYKISAGACLVPSDLPSVKVVILHDLLRCLSASQFSNSISFLLLVSPLYFF